MKTKRFVVINSQDLNQVSEIGEQEEAEKTAREWASEENEIFVVAEIKSIALPQVEVPEELKGFAQL